MNTPSRPLTPLERAILRAVVELGEEAHQSAILSKATEIRGRHIDRSHLYTVLRNLEHFGYIQEFQGAKLMYRNTKRPVYWRPAFDLTEVLTEL